MSNQLYIFDGMALLFRSFHAMGTRLSTADGRAVGAVYGFLRTVFKVLQEHKPTHAVVAWDLKEKTFRHKIYQEYKANRDAPPEDLIPQIAMIHEVVSALKIPNLSKPGYEADDIIGTLSKTFPKHGQVTIVSGDKDLMQLVNDDVRILSIKKGDAFEITAHEQVKEKMGVNPDQIVDYLAMVGDASDNIPGVRGIGPKAACVLLQEYGTLENIYANIDLIKNGRAKNALEKAKKEAFLSQELVKIACDIELEKAADDLLFSMDDLKLNRDGKEMLQGLRMTTLVKQVWGAGAVWPAASDAPPPQSVQEGLFATAAAAVVEEAPSTADWGKRAYRFVLCRSELDEVFQKIASAKEAFAFDTETTGLDILEDNPVGFSICFREDEAYYVPACVEHLPGGRSFVGEVKEPAFQPEEVWSELSRALQQRTAPLVAHNLKYDLHMLQNVDVKVGVAPLYCSQVAAWIVNPGAGGYSLDKTTLRCCNLEKIPTENLIGKKPVPSAMLNVSTDTLAEYACEDVDATLRVWHCLEKEMKEVGVTQLFREIEMPLLVVLKDMEREGVFLDAEYFGGLTMELQARIMEIEENCYEQAGQRFNISSPKQLGVILFEILKVHEELGIKDRLKKTKIGYQTNVSVLEKYGAHPFVALIKEYRELSKLLNTYVQTLPSLVKASSGRVHSNFLQTGTATGRIASMAPNLQNIPVRTVWGKRIRKGFRASTQENVIMAADYSQIELRVMAHLAKDKNMLEAFENNADIHRETAAKILGKDPSEVTSEERSKAKAINFGIIYGMGPQRLAKEQKIPLSEAKAFIEKYFFTYEGVRDFIEKTKQEAREKGFVSTAFGRIRKVPNINSANSGEARLAENVAVNTPIQGTAADVVKLGMMRVHAGLEKAGLKTKMLLQVHDELVFEGPRAEAEQVSHIVKEALEGAASFSVPLTVDVGVADTWVDAK